MTMLQATQVSYRIGSAELVAGVDFEVGPGELVVVAGPNGAGKTTLLRLLAGDLSPSGGSVRFSGQEAHDLGRTRLARTRAFLGQGRTAGNPFSVADVVAMGAWAHGASEDEVDAAIEAMDVAHLSNRVVGSLSSGEHTRVELARILVQDTPVLLLDEPLTALDIGHQERVMRHLRGLAAAGRALVVVLHDLNVAAAYATTLVLMDNGSVLRSGIPHDVLDPVLLSDLYAQRMRVVNVDGRPVVLPTD